MAHLSRQKHPVMHLVPIPQRLPKLHRDTDEITLLA
jgi:hypothetical protein